MSKKLWKEVEGERQYLIPDGTPLEAGNLEIENSSGDKMMVSEEMISQYLASQEEVEEHQDQAVEETIAELGKAFSSLFQAGKNLFSQALQEPASENENPDDENPVDEEESEEESDNVVDVDFEEKNGEDSEGFFSGLNEIFQESKVEFQSILNEAKEEFKKSLRDKETTDLLKNIGNQIVDFANTLQQEASESEEDSEPEESNFGSEEGTSDTDPPAPHPVENSETTAEKTDEDSDDAPPSPLSDNE